MKRRWLALALLVMCGASACTTEDRDDFFLFLVLIGFGIAASLGSLVGSGFALAWAAMRKPRGFVNLALAIPCSAAALVLEGSALSMSSSTHGVDRNDFFLMAMTSTPLCWLAATVMSVLMRPRVVVPVIESPETAYRGGPPQLQPQPPPPLLTVNVIVFAIVPPVLVLVAYFIGLYFLLPEHIAPAVAP